MVEGEHENSTKYFGHSTTLTATSSQIRIFGIPLINQLISSNQDPDTVRFEFQTGDMGSFWNINRSTRPCSRGDTLLGDHVRLSFLHALSFFWHER